MKISLLEPIGVSEETIETLSAGIKALGHVFMYYNDLSTDPAELLRRSQGSEVIMIANNPYPAEVIEQAAQLKMLSIAFTGIDHVATDVCKKKGITVCNASGYSNETVAELIIGMAISALRRVKEANTRVYTQGTSAGLGGGEICDRTVGIIGLGKIGMRVAELFHAFGAKVIAYDPVPSVKAAEMGVQYKSLDEVLSSSDIVSLNLLLNASTRGLINEKCIAMLKKDAIFINCARGPIVDNTALAKALNDDRLAFACVDVYDMEPPIPLDYPLLSAKNALLTPHIAFISEEAMLRRARIAFDNVYAYLEGRAQNVCVL